MTIGGFGGATPSRSKGTTRWGKKKTVDEIAHSPGGEAASPRGSRRRLQIIEAATQQFAETGYRAASLREIAQRVGITHPGLLYHFKSKEELLITVLRHRDEVQNEELSPTHFPDHLDVLQGVVDMVRHSATQPGLVELFVNLASEAVEANHPAHQYFAERYDRVRAECEEVFTNLAERGLLRPGVAPRVAAEMLVALVDGLQIQWLYQKQRLDMGSAVEAYFTTVLIAPLQELRVSQRAAG